MAFSFAKPSKQVVLLGAVLFGILSFTANSMFTHMHAAPLHHNAQQPVTHFIAFGDSGSGATQQFDMATQMRNLYDRNPFEAVVILGDVIYPVGDVHKYGESRYKEPYKYFMQEKHVPFIIALGNHDVMLGHVEKQLAFYNMPGRYYKKTIGKDVPVDVFVLDTNTFSHDKEQIFWLAKALSESKAPWKVVVGHHPVFSSGNHGSNEKLQMTLVPLLVKYKVPLYLAGHEHTYERFSPIQGVTYITSGGGGAFLHPILRRPIAHSVMHVKMFNFLSLEATPNTLDIQTITRDGSLLDNVSIHKPD